MSTAQELQIIEKLCDGILPVSGPSDAAEGTYLVQVRKTPTSGYGLFAVRDIPRGTLIIDEEPLIMIPAVADEATTTAFCDALGRCSDEALARLDRHSMDAVAWKAVSRGSIFQDIWRWCETHRAVKTDGQRRTRAEFRRAVEAVCRAYGIFFTNNLDVGAATGRGVFSLFSRMNHACRPSTHEQYDAATGRLRVRTLRDLAAGDELHSTYIDLLAPRAQRQKKLLQWGFVCACAGACARGPAEDARNDWAVDLDDMLGEYFWYKDNYPDGPPPEEDGAPDLADDVEAFHAGQDLVDTLLRLGLLGEPLFNAYRCCSKLAYDMGDVEEALRYARKALDVEVCCVGPEGTLAEPGEDTAEWIEMLEKKLPPKPEADGKPERKSQLKPKANGRQEAPIQCEIGGNGMTAS